MVCFAFVLTLKTFPDMLSAAFRWMKRQTKDGAPVFHVLILLFVFIICLNVDDTTASLFVLE